MKIWELVDNRTCVLVNSNLCVKFVSPLELLITFDDSLKITLAMFA